MKKLVLGLLVALFILTLPLGAFAADDEIAEIQEDFAEIMEQIEALWDAAEDLEAKIIALEGDRAIPASDDAVRTGSAFGFGGEITAEVTLNADGSIAALQLDAGSETQGIGSNVGEKHFTEQFIGKTGPFEYGRGVDALAGATISSNAALEAINQAVPALDSKSDRAIPASDDAVRTGRAMGFGGEITAEVTLNADGSIAALQVDAGSETQGIGSNVSKKHFTEQFIGKTGPFEFGNNVDAVAGATISSNAALEAINKAIDDFAPDVPDTQSARDAAGSITRLTDLGNEYFVGAKKAELVENSEGEACILLTLEWSHTRNAPIPFAESVVARAYQNGMRCALNVISGDGWNYANNNQKIESGEALDVYKAFVLYDAESPIDVEIQRARASKDDPMLKLRIDPARLE